MSYDVYDKGMCKAHVAYTYNEIVSDLEEDSNLTHVTVWVNFEKNVLNERNETQSIKSHAIPMS